MAYLVSAETLRMGRPYTVTVSGRRLDRRGALTSALFLDEPTISAAGAGVEFNAVGNHEFDKGAAVAADARGRLRQVYDEDAVRARAVQGRAVQIPCGQCGDAARRAVPGTASRISGRCRSASSA